MKKLVFIIIHLYIFVFAVQAQDNNRFIFDNQQQEDQKKKNNETTKPMSAEELKLDSLNKVPPPIPSWKITERLGERIPTPMDTTLTGFNQTSLVDGKDVAVGYLGNWGSPTQTKIYFDEKERSQFMFLDPFSYYHKLPQDQLFLSTKQPYSNVMYQSGGSSQRKEERFTGELSMSFNKYLTVGVEVDYSYARGYYQHLSNKQTNANAFVSYTGERYQMHAFLGTNAYNNSENGGITDPGYLSGTTDDDISKSQTLDFPTNIPQAWNRLNGTQLYMTNKYNVGYTPKNDSTDFIPVANVILTSHYQDQRRRFYSNNLDDLDTYYNYNADEHNGINSTVDDHMSYWSFKNTLGIGLNEGFREWVKFGLTGFIEQDVRKYLSPSETLPWILNDTRGQNSTVIGGILSKEKGKYLKYKLSADVGVLGYNSGEFNIKANITTNFKLMDRDVTFKAKGYVKSLKPTFYQNNYSSKYYTWSNDFDDTKRMFAGGEIYIPHTQTRFSGGVENIKNLIYLNKEKGANTTIQQDGGSVQVVSFRLDQNLSSGIFHWDNQIVFQTSSNETVLPLPKLSLYSNAYIQTKIAKVLQIQLGIDLHYFTKYYSQGYDPALLQFYNQKETKVGNFPFSTVYANLHLKKTRFFVMMYNVFQHSDDYNYFTLPDYPVNPMIFKFGLSWNFTN